MMIKHFYSVSIAFLFAMLSLTSCIKDEAPNAEADILSCIVDESLLIRTPVITNDEVKLYVNADRWSDISHLAPQFTLTGGATIEPASGTVRDFTQPQKYTVTSQDGKWKKTYTVSFLLGDLATEYHFENVRYYEHEGKKYFHIFYDTSIEGEEMTWASGNAGYMITHTSSPATDYPTSQADNGYKGKCVKLTTLSTGALGAMFGAPIAAGNLFTGVFEVNLGNMLKSTHFGLPFRKIPQTLVGYYKYTAGSKFTDKSGHELARKDRPDIYAVLFETTTEVPYLDGTNSLTSPNIVMMARISEAKETTEWKPFVLPFHKMEGKEVDADKLKAGRYSLAIVLSSSIDGGKFNGAVGSTLYVDEMNLYYE